MRVKENHNIKNNLKKLSGEKSVHIGMTRSDEKIHPDHFDVTDHDNFTDLSIPLEIPTYTIFPESFLAMFLFYDLSGTEMKVMTYLHKMTFGFLTKGNPNIISDTQDLPFNRAHVAYGNFSKYVTVNMRNRFQRTSVRKISEVIRVHKTQVQRAVDELESKKLIQRYSTMGIKTHYGINYFTIEGVFGGFSSILDYNDFVEFTKKNDLVKFKNNKMIGIKFCIENFYGSLPKKTKRKKLEIQPQEKVILSKIFKNNEFLP